jgi:hypothetical protein
MEFVISLVALLLQVVIIVIVMTVVIGHVTVVIFVKLFLEEEVINVVGKIVVVEARRLRLRHRHRVLFRKIVRIVIQIRVKLRLIAKVPVTPARFLIVGRLSPVIQLPTQSLAVVGTGFLLE